MRIPVKVAKTNKSKKVFLTYPPSYFYIPLMAWLGFCPVTFFWKRHFIVSGSLSFFTSGRKSTHLNIVTRNNANDENRTLAASAASASRARSSKYFDLLKAPENEIPSLVSFPGLDQGKVSEDGAFHDVVFAVENLERRKCSDLIKSLAPSYPPPRLQ